MRLLHRAVFVAVLSILALSLGLGSLEAQRGDRAVGPFVGQAIQFDVSPAMRDVKSSPKMPQGFVFQVPHRKPRGERPADRPGRQDPLRQTSSAPTFEAASTLPPGLYFEGLSDDDNAQVIGGRIVPPDTNGDIGPNHYVQTINSIWAVWDIDRTISPPEATMVTGFPKEGNSFWSGFTGPCEANNDGDPIVLYDHLADRWFVSQFSIDEGIQCVAVSQTSDPTGAYYRWAFLVSPGENNDYPKFGMMPEAYYLTLRDFPSNDGTFAGFVALDRAALIAGNSLATFVKFSLPCASGDCPDGVQPPHLEGPAPSSAVPGIFTRYWDDDFEGPLTGADGVRLWALVPNFVNPSSSTFTELPFAGGAEFDSTMCGFFQRNCIPQPRRGGGERVDPADELQMYRAQYRNFGTHDSIVLATTVDATGDNVAGMRWAELRNVGGSGWSIHQEGTYAPADGDHRWMGSVAMNGSGAIALGYSVSSTSTYPSIRYTSRCEGDTPGLMTGGEEELVAGGGSQTNSYNRWGDYSSMSVDPIDDDTFWYTQQYYANTGSFDFKTGIGAFSVGCGGGNQCTPTPGEDVKELTCGDGVDNDCDGFTDGDDTDCQLACTPDEEPFELTCDDGQDNDCDGDIDLADGDCAGACVPESDREKGRRKCSDGVDNDCDGLVDLDDPDC